MGHASVSAIRSDAKDAEFHNNAAYIDHLPAVANATM
jgi:hypothetical protein